MAKQPESSVGYSVTIPPSQQGTQSPRPETVFSPPPFPSSTGPIFPPPIVQPNQIPSPSIKTPNLPSPANGVRTGSPAPHLSTPPGPPVFSSPLQPAAVPLRTSPATPQPLAYSSASSLPTSSPPHFSNGSVELHHQSSDATEDWTPATESPNVLFSAHKVLKQKKLANIPSLGFGALVSTGREMSPGPQMIQRDPHRCHNCGAYANLYCNILHGSGQWQCVICRNLNGSEGEFR